MKKDPKIFLKHILESIDEAENHIEGLTKDAFLKDLKTQDAVIRRVEIIGEAVKNLPSSFKKKYPEINWREMAGMRDVVIHQYFGVDLDTVWEVVKKDLPKLKKKISKLLK